VRITDIRQMFDGKYICHADLIDGEGRRRVARYIIDRVERETVVGDGGMRGTKSVLYFRARPNGFQPKPLVLNSANTISCATVCGLPSPTSDINQTWGGKEIELYVGEAKAVKKWIPIYGKMMPAIRIRARSRAAEEAEEKVEDLAAAVAVRDDFEEEKKP
jgi:hypothetical protein